VGAGNQLYVGFGGAAFIRTYSYSARIVQWNPSTRFTYTVAGVGAGSSRTRGQNLVMTKGGTTEYIFNKTSGTVTKISSGKTQKTRAPTSAPGVRRKALVQKRAVEAEDIGADVPATMGKPSSPPFIVENLSTTKDNGVHILLQNIPNMFIHHTHIQVPGSRTLLMRRVASILALRTSWLSSKAPSQTSNG
jgi:hypothetical protein